MNRLFKYLFYLALAFVIYTFFHDIRNGKITPDTALDKSEHQLFSRIEKAFYYPENTAK